MGSQYAKTRHNVGMLCLEYLQKKHKSPPFKVKASYISGITDFKVIGTDMNALLLSPITFMNIIGKNTAKALKSERLDKTALIVLHDDLEQRLGRFRVVQGTSFK